MKRPILKLLKAGGIALKNSNCRNVLKQVKELADKQAKELVGLYIGKYK